MRPIDRSARLGRSYPLGDYLYGSYKSLRVRRRFVPLDAPEVAMFAFNATSQRRVVDHPLSVPEVHQGQFGISVIEIKLKIDGELISRHAVDEIVDDELLLYRSL